MHRHNIPMTAIVAAGVLAVAAGAWAQDKAPGKLAPGCKEWKDTDFVHPPLKVFEPYKRFHEYPVVAWCFHGRKAKFVAYDETYARNAKAAGFNVLIDAAAMLEPCRKVGGMVVVVPAFHHAPDRLMSSIFKPYGDHPCLAGLVVDDNNPRIHPNVIKNAKWITEAYPHVMPWDSENPDPRTQSRTTMRIVGTQNYPFLRGARGHKATAAYCRGCNFDRAFGNNHNMSMWEIFGGNVSMNQMKFQMLCALAYGAQGVVNFAYTPHRDTPYRGKMYQPDSPLIPQFKKIHDYIRLVIGRHLWGCRGIDVIHSIHGGDHTYAKHKIQAPRPHAGQLVVRMSEFFLVGLLTPEKRFFAKDTAIPEYFMILDKRTSSHGAPERMDTYVMLSKKMPVVEMLDETATKDANVRKLIPGARIRMKTEGGDGLLVRVCPDIDTLLGGKEGVDLYTRINNVLADLEWKHTPPAAAGKPVAEGLLKIIAVDAKEIARAVEVAKKHVVALEKVLAAAVKAGTISEAQAADTIKRLKDTIATAADEASKVPAPPEDKKKG